MMTMLLLLLLLMVLQSRVDGLLDFVILFRVENLRPLLKYGAWREARGK